MHNYKIFNVQQSAKLTKFFISWHLADTMETTYYVRHRKALPSTRHVSSSSTAFNLWAGTQNWVTMLI
jgi:hypothetical protein